MHVFWDTILRPILQLLRPKTIVEIGVERGKTTELLLTFCRETGAVLCGIDPSPLINEAEWKERWGDAWTLSRGKSLDVLPTLPPFDAALIDGDHNWYTVLQELQLIDQHATLSDRMPIVFLHDIDAPYGRRDRYDDPEHIPAEARQSWERGSINGLNPDTCHAKREGGPKNGVRTAIEDFLREREGQYVFYGVHGFFGLGILVPRALLDTNTPLRNLLNDLSPPALLQRYIEQLERERLSLLPLGNQLAQTLRENAQLHRERSELQRAFDQLEMQMHHLQEERDSLAVQLSEAKVLLNRMQRTRSWRWTGWIRRACSFWLLAIGSVEESKKPTATGQ